MRGVTMKYTEGCHIQQLNGVPSTGQATRTRLLRIAREWQVQLLVPLLYWKVREARRDTWYRLVSDEGVHDALNYSMEKPTKYFRDLCRPMINEWKNTWMEARRLFMSIHYGSPNIIWIHKLIIIRPEFLSSSDISSTIVYVNFISGMDVGGFRFDFPDRQQIFLFSKMSRPTLGPTRPHV